MTKFYADPDPVGVTPPNDNDRTQIHKIVGGDSLIIETIVLTPEGEPATPNNSKLMFTLSDQRFSRDPIWTGYWHDGIVQAGGATPGRVQIRVPDDITARLRRGSFIYSLRATDKLDNARRTVLTGSLLVEYEATSPHRDIPYKPEP